MPRRPLPQRSRHRGFALKDLMQQARTCQTMEIDVSGVTTVDDAGATLAIRAIKALRDAKRETVLIGAENLAGKKMAKGL